MSESEPNIPPTGGFVKLYRDILNKSLWKDEKSFRLFAFILLSVKYERSLYSDGLIKIWLEPGEMIGSIRWLSEQTGLTKSQTEFRLKVLRESDTLQTDCRQGLTVIKLNNFVCYHDQNIIFQTESRQRVDAEWTESRRRVGQSKELKKRRIEEIKNKYSASLTPYQGDLVSEWVKFTKEFSKTKIEPNPEIYAKAVLDLERIAGVKCEKLRDVLDFVKNDDFWRPNALSLPRLLNKSKNGLRKIENILQSMEKDTKGKTSEGFDAEGFTAFMKEKGLA